MHKTTRKRPHSHTNINSQLPTENNIRSKLPQRRRIGNNPTNRAIRNSSVTDAKYSMIHFLETKLIQQINDIELLNSNHPSANYLDPNKIRINEILIKELIDDMVKQNYITEKEKIGILNEIKKMNHVLREKLGNDNIKQVPNNRNRANFNYLRPPKEIISIPDPNENPFIINEKYRRITRKRLSEGKKSILNQYLHNKESGLNTRRFDKFKRTQKKTSNKPSSRRTSDPISYIYHPNDGSLSNDGLSNYESPYHNSPHGQND
jgi:hypothetical protein